MAEIGYATLGIIPSFDGFERNLTRGTSGPMASVGGQAGTTFGNAAGKTAGSRFGSAFKTAAKAGLIGLGALGVGAFKLAGDAVSAASDLEESTNKVAQVFGKGADDVFRFSSKAADALGQTNQAARDAAATFGIFGNVAGLTDKKNAKFAKRMTKLASDLASFNNTSPEQAIEALGAALRGESEPIRAYGVLLDEATLKAEAMRIGLIKPVKDQAKIQQYQVNIMKGQKAYNEALEEHGPKSLEVLDAQAKLGYAQGQLEKATAGTIPPLTQQQKVLAAQSSIFKQTEVAQGDFARTSDGLANQQRRLSARFEDAKAKLGVGLLPIMTEAADFLLDKGIPAFEDFSAWFNDEGIPKIKKFGDEVKDVWGKVKDLAGELSDLPGAVKFPTAGGLAGALVAGGRIPGAQRGGALGAPLKVFETNPAALGGGLGGKKGGAAIAITTARLTGGLSLYATGVAMYAKDVERRNNVPAFGSRDNPLEQQILNPFEKNYDKDVIRTRDAFDKVRHSVDQGATSAELLRGKVTDLFRVTQKVAGEKPVKFTAPGLAGLLGQTGEYTSIIDGLDGRVVRTFFESVQGRQGRELGRGTSGIDGEGLGRTTVNNFVHNGNIVANEPRDYDNWRKNRNRARAGGAR